MNYIGDFAEDSTVRIALTTNNGDGAAVAPSSAFEAADFVIYKNGSATQKATTNGITCTSPFDSVVGLHILEIDTSNDTGDSGFWTTGADYWVVAIPDETVDSQTVVQVIATFSIENRIRVKATDTVLLASGATSTAIAAIQTTASDISDRIPADLENGYMMASVQAMVADALTASALASDAVAEIQSGLATSSALTTVESKVDIIDTNVDTLLSRITSTIFSGITYLSRWLGAIAGKTADTTTRAEINATTAGAGYNETTDSQEAIRDRGDAAWTTGSGSGSGTVVVGPLVQTNAQRALPAYIETYQYSKASVGPFRLEDSEGDQFDLASQTDWIVVVCDKDDNALGTVPYGDIDFTSSTSNAVMDQYAFAPIAAQVATAGRHYFALRRPQGTDEQVATSGVFNVIKAPRGASS